MPLPRWAGLKSRYAERDLLADADILAGVRADGSSRSAPDRAREGLGAAVARGVLIPLGVEDEQRWYVLASEENRRKAHQGAFTIPDLPEPTPLPIERPGIYALYEQNIGLLSPLIADRLADALLRYPEQWIAEAIGEAVAYNRRSWRYIERILENWATEGRLMKPIGEIMKRIELPEKPSGTSTASTSATSDVCPICQGAGFVRIDARGR